MTPNDFHNYDNGTNSTLARICLWLVGAVAVGMAIGGMR